MIVTAAASRAVRASLSSAVSLGAPFLDAAAFFDTPAFFFAVTPPAELLPLAPPAALVSLDVAPPPAVVPFLAPGAAFLAGAATFFATVPAPTAFLAPVGQAARTARRASCAHFPLTVADPGARLRPGAGGRGVCVRWHGSGGRAVRGAAAASGSRSRPRPARRPAPRRPANLLARLYLPSLFFRVTARPRRLGGYLAAWYRYSFHGTSPTEYGFAGGDF